MKETKFSVVVPTMWRYDPFLEFLKCLVNVDLIGEINVINNAIDKTPDIEILKHPKIKMHNFALNIFINPAWNYGVGISNYNKVCIINDDVIFDTLIFNKVFELLTPGTLIVNSPPPPGSSLVNGLIKIQHFTDPDRPWEFGSMMFVHRDNWIDIPAGLDFFHGDTWIWETMRLRYDHNYVIKDMFFFTPQSATLDSGVLTNREFIYIERECKIYLAAIALFKHKLLL
jgi:hypothetical protein